MDVKVRKPHNLLWICRGAYGTTWDLRPKVVHWLYISITRPSITSASLVWCPGCQTASAKKRLSRVQRLTCLGITGAMRTASTSAMVALTGLPPLELLVQSKARLVAHCLWSLGCWSYLHPNRGHCSIMMRFQQSDPILNMGVEVMRPPFNLEPKYRVIMLTREEGTRGPGTPPVVKGLVWFYRWIQDEGGESMGILWEEGSVSL